MADVGSTDIYSHAQHTSMENDEKSMEEEDEKLKCLRSFQPVEKQASNYRIERMRETSSSEMQTSDVKLKEKLWRKSKKSVACICY